MPRNNTRKNKGRKRARRTRTHRKLGGENGNLIVRENPRFPNDIKQLPIMGRTIRYVCITALAAQTFTPGDLLKMMIFTVNTSATAYTLARCIRIKHISMYFVPSSGDFADNTKVLSFKWSGANNACDNLITDRGTATQPACIKVRPPRGTISETWFDPTSTGATNTLFTITCPTNTIIDINFEFVLSDGNSTTVTLSGAATSTGCAILGLFTNHLVPDGGVVSFHE